MKKIKSTKAFKDAVDVAFDTQTKRDRKKREYDEQRKAARLEEIRQIYAEEIGDMADILPFDRLNKAEWLNKSTTDKTIRGDIQTAVINAQAAIAQIRDLHSPHENAIIAAFLERLSLIDALNTKKRLEDMDAAMEKRRVEEEAARKAEEPEPVFIYDTPPDEEPVEPVFIKDAPVDDEPTMDFTFTVKNATTAHLEALTTFLEENGYNYALEV